MFPVPSSVWGIPIVLVWVPIGGEVAGARGRAGGRGVGGVVHRGRGEAGVGGGVGGRGKGDKRGRGRGRGRDGEGDIGG